MTELNRFDYFSDIEDTFVRLRGSHLLLSPLDWELMEQWKNDGVPLHVVLRTIEEVFEKRAAKGDAKRPISSLRFCKDAVEESFRHWKSMRVGANEATDDGGPSTDANPFATEKVKEYLAGSIEALVRISIERANANTTDALYWATLAATAEIVNLAEKFSVEPNARELEEKLASIERNLDIAIDKVASAAQATEAHAAAEALYRPYKTVMPEKVYEQQIDNDLKKRLRAIFDVPRLSLFHMKG